MISDQELIEVLADQDLSQKDHVLATLAFLDGGPSSPAQIAKAAAAHGRPEAAKWNVSRALGSSGGFASKLKDGWVLTTKGKSHVASIDQVGARPVISTKLSKQLMAAAAKAKSSEERAFIEEAVHCFEAKLYRAAVVLSWVGAIAVLHDEVVSKHLADFNREAARRDAKWRKAKSADDLGRMREAAFLDVLAHLSVLGKNVKTELQRCLDLRNGCGHPNSLKLGEARVAAHLETLILNVFQVFG